MRRLGKRWFQLHKLVYLAAIGGVVRACFVAKDEVRGWPVMGALASLQQTVFISRNSRDARAAAGALSGALAAGHRLVLFPEGTTSDGSGVLPFKSSIFALLAEPSLSQVPLQPVSLALLEVDGRAVDAGGNRDLYAYHGDMHLGPHLLAFMRVSGARLRLRFHSPLVGSFNVENLLVATGIGLALGLSRDVIEGALALATGAPGRLERVGEQPACYVDYAHTPDALERALAALRPITRGKLWVVFGCGGDRDRGKRPLMGRIAEEGADQVLVTSDNPRTEDPRSILVQITDGLRREPFAVIESRRDAICAAVHAMEPEDTLLVAGKGHEDYQIVGTERHHFDDREEVRAALQRRR